MTKPQNTHSLDELLVEPFLFIVNHIWRVLKLLKYILNPTELCCYSKFICQMNFSTRTLLTRVSFIRSNNFFLCLS